jgi:hypothetical protein
MAERFTCSRCDASWTGHRACHCSGCCRTFSGVDLFDRHRSLAGEHGTCHDPETITYRSGPREGRHVMVLRNGIWSSPEMTEAQKEALFGARS